MDEILITRYGHIIENNSITHITTNLSASEIENVYGNRLRSRMRNMFNLVSFESNFKVRDYVSFKIRETVKYIYSLSLYFEFELICIEELINLNTSSKIE